MAKVKLIDVAERAGVSKSTVSQYLNGRFDYMSESTKERITEAVAALNYVPNAIARSLKTDKTRTIGVIVRDITGYYTSRALRGIDDYCKSKGYNVLIHSTDFASEVEIKSLQTLSQLSVDGIAITPSGSNSSLIADYAKKGLPVVQFQIEHGENEQSIVVSDYKKAAFDATEYLIQLGHKRICFVTQDFYTVKSRRERYQGYAQALKQYGIPLNERFILQWDRVTGFERPPLDLFNDEPAPTAFFTQHLAITEALLMLFNDNNVEIPNDVSLIGFDELPMVKFFKVPITVVKQNPYEVGVKVAETLLNNINNEPAPEQRIMVPCVLAKRQSCKSINA